MSFLTEYSLWTRDPDGVPITGTKRATYLEENVGGASVELTSADCRHGVVQRIVAVPVRANLLQIGARPTFPHVRGAGIARIR